MGNIGEGKTLDEFLAETLKRELVVLDELLSDRAGEAELVALLEAVRRADLALLESVLRLTGS